MKFSKIVALLLALAFLLCACGKGQTVTEPTEETVPSAYPDAPGGNNVNPQSLSPQFAIQDGGSMFSGVSAYSGS